jgi:hypothetical protein
MKAVEQHMRAEREACEGRDQCHLTVTMLASGAFRARLSFQPGMETASADGTTIEEAVSRLEQVLGGGK